MTLLDKSTCDHARLGPLPYDGTPVDPEEWECLDCGLWHFADASARGPEPAYPYDWSAEEYATTAAAATQSSIESMKRHLEGLLRNTVIPVGPPSLRVFEMRGSSARALSFDSVTVREALERLGAQLEILPPSVPSLSSPDLRVTLDLDGKASGEARASMRSAWHAAYALKGASTRPLLVELMATAAAPDESSALGAFYGLRDLTMSASFSWRASREVLRWMRLDAYHGQGFAGGPRGMVLGGDVEPDDAMGRRVGLVVER